MYNNGVHGKQYEVGMYGGSFNPLHLGHVDCMIQAAALCESLYIVLSYRKNSSDVEMKVKYRWIYQLTQHLGNVKILTLEDTLMNKCDYTENYWEDDCKKVREMIGRKIDVVFCGSDYDKNSFWNICYPESAFIVFDRNEYSSTKIRENVYQHWDWMPGCVRKHFAKKVLLIGGESAGKSTLTINLAHHYNTCYLEEVGRELSELSGTDIMMIPEDYQRILINHKGKEMELLNQCNKVLFEDTDCLITRFYMGFLENDQMHNEIQLAEAIAGINQYDLILFLEPDVTWVQDGDRSEVIAADREKYSQRIKKIYEDAGFSVVSVRGSYTDRFRMAVKLVDDLLENSNYEDMTKGERGWGR